MRQWEMIELIANCEICNSIFSANAGYVPSMRVNESGYQTFEENYYRQIVYCQPCVEEVNRKRESIGLLAVFVHPLAYDVTQD